MSASPQTNLRLVLSQLAAEMRSSRDRMNRALQDAGGLSEEVAGATTGSEPPGVVIVLGAGCSIQYGFPSFERLLEYAYDDLGIEPKRDEERGEERGLDALRERLDWHWRTLKPAPLRELLNRYLSGLRGRHATGYLRLARLARKGYVKAIVNMNFDLLLRDAFDWLQDQDGESPEAPRRSPYTSRTFELRVASPQCADPDGKVPRTCRLGGRFPRFDLLEFYNRHVPVYIPHGSLEPGTGVPVLDLAGSDLFGSRSENRAVEQLFRNNDVVFLGYRGGDSKIAAALRPEQPVFDEQEADPASYNKVYFFALEPPDPRLVRIMAAKRSTELIVTGEVAAFENVMTELEKLVEIPQESSFEEPCLDHRKEPARQDRERDRSKGGVAASPHFTEEESRCLFEWRRLALAIRASMRVAERSDLSIEEHADEIFETCIRLARAARIGLTTPEKFLLYCAAYIHDLGYFWAYSGNHKHDKKAGWSLLTTHGHDSAALLHRYATGQRSEVPGEDAVPRPDGPEALFPSSYASDAPLMHTVVALCHLHSMADLHDVRREKASTAPSGPASDSHRADDLGELPESFAVQIDGLEIGVRPSLLHALFHTAEETAQGHPFRPAPYPLEAHGEAERELEDPALDLYLRQKPGLLSYRFAPGRVTVCPKGERSDDGLGETRKLLLILAKNAVAHLSTAVQEVGAPPLDFKSDPKVDASPEGSEAFSEAARDALDEQLEAKVDELRLASKSPSGRIGLVPTLLDLLALYTDPIYRRTGEKGDAELYEVSASSSGLRAARDLLESEPFAREAARHPIYHYLRGKYWNGVESAVDLAFRKSFETIYRPAWRFCADKWLYGIDPLVMARVSLDLGSSRFRDEVAIGLKDLFDEHVYPETVDGDDGTRIDHAYGHDGCTICTSRLLYIATRAREILPAEMRSRIHGGENRLEKTTAALLRFLLGRKSGDAAWWGIEKEHVGDGDRQKLRSGDYITWGIRALAHALVLDQRIEQSGAPSWLGEECRLGMNGGAARQRLRELVRGLLEELIKTPPKELVSPQTEEPHSYIVGHVGGLYLALQDLDADWNCEILPPDFDWTPAEEQIGFALDEIAGHTSAQLSQYFLWPAEVFLAKRKNEEGLDAALVKKLHQCIHSRVWIRLGQGRGSWGYNIDNTQRIVSSLNTAWGLILRDKERFEEHFRAYTWDPDVEDQSRPSAGIVVNRTRRLD